jgi:cyclopropane fatty-acyl-phospholipid synthase-like methyltransferase
MPGNWGYLGSDVKQYLVENFDPSNTILDIGCGHGFYIKLLKDHFQKFDAVEVWAPYIEEYKEGSCFKQTEKLNLNYWVKLIQETSKNI